MELDEGNFLKKVSDIIEMSAPESTMAQVVSLSTLILTTGVWIGIFLPANNSIPGTEIPACPGVFSFPVHFYLPDFPFPASSFYTAYICDLLYHSEHILGSLDP